MPPEYWDTGVAVLLFDELARRAAAKGYRWADLSLTSADNPRTPILAEHLGARGVQTLSRLSEVVDAALGCEVTMVLHLLGA